MSEYKKINLIPMIDTFWDGFGNNFENFMQVVNEFVDNSISHYIGNNIEDEKYI